MKKIIISLIMFMSMGCSEYKEKKDTQTTIADNQSKNIKNDVSCQVKIISEGLIEIILTNISQKETSFKFPSLFLQTGNDASDTKDQFVDEFVITCNKIKDASINGNKIMMDKNCTVFLKEKEQLECHYKIPVQKRGKYYLTLENSPKIDLLTKSIILK